MRRLTTTAVLARIALAELISESAFSAAHRRSAARSVTRPGVSGLSGRRVAFTAVAGQRVPDTQHTAAP